MRALSLLLLCVFFAGCGGETLTVPEDLTILTYPADMPFRMSFVMLSCGDPCRTYQQEECTVELDEESPTLNVEVSVSVEDKDGVDRSALDQCSLECSTPVLAHCDVGALPAGEYEVVSGAFMRKISVQP